jgi:hypothetical protein
MFQILDISSKVRQGGGERVAWAIESENYGKKKRPPLKKTKREGRGT